MNDEKIRVSSRFKKMLKDSAIQRIQNKVDKELRSSREMSEMMLNTPSINEVLKELKTIPKMEDMR